MHLLLVFDEWFGGRKRKQWTRGDHSEYLGLLAGHMEGADCKHVWESASDRVPTCAGTTASELFRGCRVEDWWGIIPKNQTQTEELCMV